MKSELTVRVAGGGIASHTGRTWRLQIPSGGAGGYRLSQLDNASGLSRSQYLEKAPASIRLRARVSSAAHAGTWGFGFWNDPFGMGCFPPREILRLPTLPQAAWFFFASQRSHLSLRDDKPANGFFAQVLRSTQARVRPLAAALTWPIDNAAARRLMQRVVHEDGALVAAGVHAWHNYEVQWLPTKTRFTMDGRLVLESNCSPRGPLCIVIWIDNQYANLSRRPIPTWGVEATQNPSWMDVKDLRQE